MGPGSDASAVGGGLGSPVPLFTCLCTRSGESLRERFESYVNRPYMQRSVCHLFTRRNGPNIGLERQNGHFVGCVERGPDSHGDRLYECLADRRERSAQDAEAQDFEGGAMRTIGCLLIVILTSIATVLVPAYARARLLAYLWDCDGDGKADCLCSYSLIRPGEMSFTPINGSPGCVFVGELDLMAPSSMTEDLPSCLNCISGDPSTIPLPRITLSVDSILTGTVITFTGTDSHSSSSGTSSSDFAWTFSDTGGTEIGQTVTHVFDKSGVYVVSLTLGSQTGLTGSCAKTLTVLPSNDLPGAAFTWAALSPSGTRLVVAPRTKDRLEFDASASSDPDGEIVEFSWDWNSDGSYDLASNDPIIEHTFASAGSHRVTLRVTDNAGAADTVTQTVTIRDEQPPSAAFRFEPSSPSILDTVEFTDMSADEDGEVTAWRWAFGDGTTSAQQHPTHQYATKGPFKVTLTVTDDDGLTGASEQLLDVVNLSPEAMFTWGHVAAREDGSRLAVEPRVGEPLRFDASVSSDPDGDIVEYAWDWTSDGAYDEISADPLTESWFDEPGTHEVTLRVSDDDGATATYTDTITIASAPELVEPARVWALVIGISDYLEVNDLRYAEADAVAFTRWLLDAGVEKDHIRLLLDEEGERDGQGGLVSQQATLARVRAGLDWLRRMAFPDDLVFVFFAGHGYQGEDDDGDEADGVDEFLVVYDTLRDCLEASSLRDDEFGYFLDRVESEHVMVVFDSCYSGGQSRSLSSGTRPLPGSFDIFQDFSLDGKLILAAASEDQKALEDETLGHGVFTHYLLRGLEGEADLDADYRVTAEELYDYVGREVERFAKEEMGARQTPQLTGRGTVGIVVARTNEPPTAAFTVEPDVPYAYGRTRFNDASTDDGEIVSRVWNFGDSSTSTDQHPTHAYEEAGTYTVTLTVTDDEGASSTFEQQIAVAPGGQVTTAAGDTIIISLGSANGVHVGDRFEVIRVLRLSSGTVIHECKAVLKVVEILDVDRSACRVVEMTDQIEPHDRLRPLDETSG